MNTPRHVLITGGAGFIGSHLAERLLADGWRVTVVDDLSTGSVENLRSAAASPSSISPASPPGVPMRSLRTTNVTSQSDGRPLNLLTASCGVRWDGIGVG